MKHILIFIVQTIIIAFLFTPFFIARFIWTFKWSDEVGSSMGKTKMYRMYGQSYRTMKNKILGRKWSYM
jgi:hypothetical protein